MYNYKYIINPLNNKKVKIYSNLGKRLLTNYIIILGGAKKYKTEPQFSFIKMIEGDILDFDFPREKFSKIFHLATTSASETFNGEDQLKKYKTLVDGTERLLKFAISSKVKKILFTS